MDGEHIEYNFSSFKSVEVCFMAQGIVYFSWLSLALLVLCLFYG